MLSAGGLGPTVEAATLIGVVLLEAVVLYGVYGLAERVLGAAVVERLVRS